MTFYIGSYTSLRSSGTFLVLIVMENTNLRCTYTYMHVVQMSTTSLHEYRWLLSSQSTMEKTKQEFVVFVHEVFKIIFKKKFIKSF
jgi:hypothetical protein